MRVALGLFVAFAVAAAPRPSSASANAAPPPSVPAAPILRVCQPYTYIITFPAGSAELTTEMVAVVYRAFLDVRQRVSQMILWTSVDASEAAGRGEALARARDAAVRDTLVRFGLAPDEFSPDSMLIPIPANVGPGAPDLRGSVQLWSYGMQLGFCG